MPFGHVDLRVADLGRAEAFYEALLPQLASTERYPGERIMSPARRGSRSPWNLTMTSMQRRTSRAPRAHSS